MQSFLDRAPMRFAARLEATARLPGLQILVLDGAGHGLVPSRCPTVCPIYRRGRQETRTNGCVYSEKVFQHLQHAHGRARTPSRPIQSGKLTLGVTTTTRSDV